MAVRDITCGEELTFDYSCVSESKEEFENATCLCGSLNCRGSFLYYADGSSFMQIMNKHNNLLRRTSILLDASLEDNDPGCPCFNDQERTLDGKLAYLHHHGVKKSMLGGCPAWMIRWCFAVMKFIEYEEQALPSEIEFLTDRQGRRLCPSLEAAKVC